MAASAALRFGPAHDRYCPIASEVLVPRAMLIAASHAASALGSTAGVVFVVVFVAVGVAVPPLVVEPVFVDPVPAEEAGSGLVPLDELGGGSEPTTTAVGVVADGNVNTSPSPPLLFPLNAKITPTMPTIMSTTMPPMIGNMLLDAGLPPAGGGGGAGYAGPPMPGPMCPCIC